MKRDDIVGWVNEDGSGEGNWSLGVVAYLAVHVAGALVVLAALTLVLWLAQ